MASARHAGPAIGVALVLAACGGGDGIASGGSGSVPDACGAACGEGRYCRLPTGHCERPAAPGRCEVRPEVCAQHYDPVCGCDGRSYSNGCEAAARGVNVAHGGACS